MRPSGPPRDPEGDPCNAEIDSDPVSAGYARRGGPKGPPLHVS